MLMLTHTWILKRYLSSDYRSHLEYYIYNICPDLLPISKGITSEVTHGISRLTHCPPQYKKAALVIFHLLVDDIAHHGTICAEPIRCFDPYSQGYAYLRGKSLIKPIMDFYHRIGREIDYGRAAYQAHMIIELAFDLRLNQEREKERLFELLSEAFYHTVDKRMDELCTTVSWLFDAERALIRQALEKGLSSQTLENIRDRMNIEGRTGFYIDRFGLNRKDDLTWAGVRMLLLEGMQLVRDYDAFLHPVLKAIKTSGFPASITPS